MCNVGELLKDGRVLNAIANISGIQYDKKFKYILKFPKGMNTLSYKGCTFKLVYTSGCFYPYLLRIS